MFAKLSLIVHLIEKRGKMQEIRKRL